MLRVCYKSGSSFSSLPTPSSESDMATTLRIHAHSPKEILHGLELPLPLPLALPPRRPTGPLLLAMGGSPQNCSTASSSPDIKSLKRLIPSLGHVGNEDGKFRIFYPRGQKGERARRALISFFAAAVVGAPNNG
ncbi:hypothetical protein ACHAXS_004877, partial [Conticribra weissflogii]